MMFRHLLNVIEKVIEGKLTDDLGNEYRYVGFLATEDEFEKYKDEACKLLAMYVNDELRDADVPEEERKKIVKQVEACLLDPYEALWKYDIHPDYQLAEIKDAEAQYLLTELLRDYTKTLIEAQATEEVAYGLPEFSLYWGADARSYTGRWLYSDASMDLDPCWALIPDDETCNKVWDIQEKLEELAKKRSEKTKKLYKWLFAIWRED